MIKHDSFILLHSMIFPRYFNQIILKFSQITHATFCDFKPKSTKSTIFLVWGQKKISCYCDEYTKHTILAKGVTTILKIAVFMKNTQKHTILKEWLNVWRQHWKNTWLMGKAPKQFERVVF